MTKNKTINVWSSHMTGYTKKADYTPKAKDFLYWERTAKEDGTKSHVSKEHVMKLCDANGDSWDEVLKAWRYETSFAVYEVRDE